MTRRVGNVIVVTPEPPRLCELCGAFAECRPYGPGGMQICFTCGEKDPETRDRYQAKLFGLSPAERKLKRKKPRFHRKPVSDERAHCPDCGKVYEGTRRVEFFTCADDVIGKGCGARWREDMYVNGKLRPEYAVIAAEAKEPDTFRLKASRCPECDHPLDAASSFDKKDPRQPHPLDFTICINCAAILRFKLDLSLRRATLLESEELPPGTLSMVQAIASMFPNGVPKKKP
jgi:hypothetical protein